MRVDGLLNEVIQPAAHVPACSVTDCDKHIERMLSRLEHTARLR